MKTIGLIAITLLGTLALGCLPEGEERCQGKYVWNSLSRSCDLKEKDDESQDTPAVENDAEVSGDGETELPSGLGEECKDNSECAAYKANQCTANDFVPVGYCTVGNCTEAANPCPSGYTCCAFTDPAMAEPCLENDEFDMVNNMGLCK